MVPIYVEFITFNSSTQTKESIVKRLVGAKINHSVAPLEAAIIDFTDKKADWAIRISPHYYNTEEEIDALIEAVKVD